MSALASERCASPPGSGKAVLAKEKKTDKSKY